MNFLYFGDNLEWLRNTKEFPDQSVDLVYLDPPFNSNADYNVLFRETSGAVSQAQFHAFTDTWSWADAADTYHQFIDACQNVAVVEMMEAFHSFLKNSPMMAYLAMMAPRLVELHRVLKETGSLYLHCDPTATHYLRMLLDGVFGGEHFLNEVAWKRTGAHGSAKRYGPVHDLLLFYSKTDEYVWNQQYQDNADYVAKRYTYTDEKGRRFYPITLHASGVRHGSSGETWREIDITAKGGHWKYAISKLEELDARGDIYWPKTGTMPRLKAYADNAKGAPIQDVWIDIPAINSQAQERLGYPTQKPFALLERIISASSDPGDVVLDPFCGCGTTIHAAQKLGRQWIGIDVTYLAINLIKRRLRDAFGEDIQFEEKGQPTDFESAKRLAELDKFQFQHWALSLVHARPLKEGDGKGADRGVDGLLYFYEAQQPAPVSARDSRAASRDSPRASGTIARGRATEHAGRVRSPAKKLKRENVHREKIIVQVKGGGTGAKDIRDLVGTVENQKAAGGVLIALEKPTKPMRDEAVSAGRYESRLWQKDYQKIQIVTIEGLLNGTERIDAPSQINPFAMAAREPTQSQQTEML